MKEARSKKVNFSLYILWHVDSRIFLGIKLFLKVVCRRVV